MLLKIERRRRNGISALLQEIKNFYMQAVHSCRARFEGCCTAVDLVNEVRRLLKPGKFVSRVESQDGRTRLVNVLKYHSGRWYSLLPPRE